MFFFGRRSEVKLLPRSKYESSNSFEGGTRFSSHFHMPTLLSVDIVCARPGRRGLAAALLAHIACLQSPFLCERTHLLFDISGREANTRMVSFTQALGAQRYQTFADEARSEGFIGVEGDDPSIFWTYKTGSGYGVNEDRTAGVYAIDQDTGTPITALHPAVLFDDRVTVSDFHRSGSSQPLLDRNAARVAGAAAFTRLPAQQLLIGRAVNRWRAPTAPTFPPPQTRQGRRRPPPPPSPFRRQCAPLLH